MIQFGMPTLIENRTLQDNIDLCRSLGLHFIELNMNFPEYQLERLEKTDELLKAAEQAGIETIEPDEKEKKRIRELLLSATKEMLEDIFPEGFYEKVDAL